ncbi:unnamed protein product [Rhizopus stolonifer]
MASYEQQAKTNIKEAQKKLNSWNFPFMGSLGSSKYEEAAEYYEKAGNMFKLAQQWKNAGDAFVEAAQLFQRGNSAKFEGSRAYDNAAKSYKRTDSTAAISAFNEQFDWTKKVVISELNQPNEAFKAYKSAADLYIANDSPAIANKCLLKVAQIAAELEDYPTAIEKYEQVAAASVDDPLLKWSLKEHFFKAGLCHLCTDDTVKSSQALANYCNMDVSFESTREYTLLKGIIECVNQGDIDRYTTLVYDYDKLSRLDAWKTAVLLKIKKAIDCEDLR